MRRLRGSARDRYKMKLERIIRKKMEDFIQGGSDVLFQHVLDQLPGVKHLPRGYQDESGRRLYAYRILRNLEDEELIEWKEGRIFWI